MSDANQDIKNLIRDSGLKYWQVADAMGKTNWTLSVWFRKPLHGEKRVLVLAAIEKAQKEYGEGAK